jgi:hypothetical protein
LSTGCMVTPYATQARRLLLKLRPKCMVLQPDTARPLVTSKKHDVGRLNATYFDTDPNRGPTLIELAPNAGPCRLGNSGFIRGSAGRGQVIIRNRASGAPSETAGAILLPNGLGAGHTWLPLGCWAPVVRQKAEGLA